MVENLKDDRLMRWLRYVERTNLRRVRKRVYMKTVDGSRKKGKPRVRVKVKNEGMYGWIKCQLEGMFSVSKG